MDGSKTGGEEDPVLVMQSGTGTTKGYRDGEDTNYTVSGEIFDHKVVF